VHRADVEDDAVEVEKEALAELDVDAVVAEKGWLDDGAAEIASALAGGRQARGRTHRTAHQRASCRARMPPIALVDAARM
jgi:hypothetical protein